MGGNGQKVKTNGIKAGREWHWVSSGPEAQTLRACILWLMRFGRRRSGKPKWNNVSMCRPLMTHGCDQERGRNTPSENVQSTFLAGQQDLNNRGSEFEGVLGESRKAIELKFGAIELIFKELRPCVLSPLLEPKGTHRARDLHT